MFSTAQLTHFAQNFSLSGGGTVTVKVVSNVIRIRWDTRVLALPLMGKAGITYYNIDCPANNVVIGSGQTVNSDGIPLGNNSSNFAAPVSYTHLTLPTKA